VHVVFRSRHISPKKAALRDVLSIRLGLIHPTQKVGTPASFTSGHATVPEEKLCRGVLRDDEVFMLDLSTLMPVVTI
jgi:hypothetical protein